MPRRIPKETHTGELNLGGVKIRCSVLDTGQRLVSLRATVGALGYRTSPSVKKSVSSNSLENYLPANILSFIDRGSRSVLKLVKYCPILDDGEYGQPLWGVRAEALPEVLKAINRADKAGALTKAQLPLARAADILTTALVGVAIVALVDKKTGYEEIADRDTLERILNRYIAKELQPWMKRFPDEFYTEIARLKGWQFNILAQEKPGIVGKYTNDLIYERLAPGVLEKLQELTPRNEQGKLKQKLHQRLTPDAGVRELDHHLVRIVMLMKDSSSWQGLMTKVKRHFPSFRSTLSLPFDDEEDDA